MSVHAKQLVLCTNIHCARGVFTDEQCKPFCPDCGSQCIELSPNPDCRVWILDVLHESDLQSCPRCGEKWMYDPDRLGLKSRPEAISHLLEPGRVP